MEKQALMHRELAGAVRRFKTSDPFSAALLLAAISFAYGVLHAAGPGHGKAVISSYVLADGQTVRRGMLLVLHGRPDPGFVRAGAGWRAGAGVAIHRLADRVMEAWLETLSWGFVTLVGAWLLYYQLRPVFAPAHAHGHGHDDHGHHHHDHAHAHDHHGHDHAHHHATTHSHAHDHHHHTHDAACEVCAHLPAPSQLQGDWSWKRAFALAFAVGIRPCTGAILVLVFAIGQGLWWAGVFSTLAMALGTAITVSALATMAVGSRELAKRLAGSGGSTKWVDRVQMAAGVGGASLVLVLGAVIFLGFARQPAAVLSKAYRALWVNDGLHCLRFRTSIYPLLNLCFWVRAAAPSFAGKQNQGHAMRTVTAAAAAAALVIGLAIQGPGRAAVDTTIRHAAINGAAGFRAPRLHLLPGLPQPRCTALSAVAAGRRGAAALRRCNSRPTPTASPSTRRSVMVPTDVVMKDGREVDRIAGYWAPDNFFKMVTYIIGKAE